MKTTISKQVIGKKVSRAFNKDIYLLGEDEQGTKYWLESPSWDCNWYWGFGYVETYTNNKNPHLSKDIQSHQHIDSSFMGKIEFYNSNLQKWDTTEYIHNIYDCPTLFKTTFTEKEGWLLSELFKNFYRLRESAEFFGKGSSNVTTNPLSNELTNKDWAKEINENLIPKITAKIIEILSA